MSATRIPFDLESPFIVASAELTYGGRRFGRGEAFPWRELGAEPLDLVRMWTFLQLDVAPDQGWTVGPADAGASKTIQVQVTPTPMVEPPADGAGPEPRRLKRARG